MRLVNGNRHRKRTTPWTIYDSKRMITVYPVVARRSRQMYVPSPHVRIILH